MRLRFPGILIIFWKGFGGSQRSWIPSPFQKFSPPFPLNIQNFSGLGWSEGRAPPAEGGKGICLGRGRCPGCAMPCFGAFVRPLLAPRFGRSRIDAPPTLACGALGAFLSSPFPPFCSMAPPSGIQSFWGSPLCLIPVGAFYF